MPIDEPHTRISPEQFKRLVTVAGEFRQEAERCAGAYCWRAALVLLASSIEAAILATACVLEQELQKIGEWPSHGWGDLAKCELAKLVSLAVKAGWLPSTGQVGEGDIFAPLEGGPAAVGDAVRFLREVRNMAVHPGRWVIEDVVPDFDDVEHMTPTYLIGKGIADEVFDRLYRTIS